MFRLFTVTSIFFILVSEVFAENSLAENHTLNSTKENEVTGNKIVGGQAARPGQYPYQVSLRFIKNYKHFCGGAIIDTRWILTAAHCFIGGERSYQIFATVGAISTYDGVHHNVSGILAHPYFNLQTVSYDIALVRVRTPFTYDRLVQPIQINLTPMVGGENGIVTGYGRFYENGPLATTLQAVAVRVISTNDCRNTFKLHPEKSLANQITSANICTAVIKGKGFCSGDSGGPLASNGRLVGIVSWSPYGCTYSGYPDVYSNVLTYKNWIDQTKTTYQ
uniref:CSON010158 protein n=1 Tax=Culicoides sonorensis TaxID=179676 RepID=A0A336K3T8_CULSO